MTFQVWWHFSFGDFSIFRGLSNIAGSPVLEPNNQTNKQLREYRAYPDFICWTAQCRNLWLEKHFSTTSLQNNDTYSVSKIKLPNFMCTYASIWLICRSQKISRNWSAPTNPQIYSFWQLKVYGLNFHPWKFWCPLLPALGAAALGKWSLLGRARVNCLKLGPIYFNCWKHFERLSLDLGPNEHII